MASYQPPVDEPAIFNSQSFSASNYDGPSDPNKLDFPNAQGIPTMVGVNVTSGANTNLITPTGIVLTNSTGNSLLGSKTTWGIGADNTVLGVGAGANGAGAVDTVGNTCIGKSAGSALLSTTSGQATNNSLVGKSAGSNITTGSSNVCVGQGAGQNIQTGGYSVCVGQGAGGSAATSGNANTFLGALTTSTINVGNTTVIGYNASATASNQVVLGTSAETVIIPSGFIAVPTGTNNLFFSSSSKSGITAIGLYNSAIGLAALQNCNASTAQNNAMGYGALQSSKASNNTGVGHYSLPNVTTGGNNTAIGANSGGINGGIGLTVGTNNTFLGADTNVEVSATVYNKSTAIGSGSLITASNQIVMGTSTESVVIPSRKIIGLVTSVIASVSPAFPLSEIYNITPSLSGTAIVITLPSSLVTANVGAKTTFRITDIGNANVSLSSSIANIFPSTTTVGLSSHNIYTGGTLVAFSPTTASISGLTLTLSAGVSLTVGTLITGGGVTSGTVVTAVGSSTSYTVNKSQISTPTNYILTTALNTHTFMLLNTTLCQGGLGWFQLGTV